MRKFQEVYKEKQNRSIELLENKILSEFKSVYNTLLETYKIADFYSLNEEEQSTFISELNSYWSEDLGVTEKGKKFLQVKSGVLSESSTSLQKKNYLKNKTITVINETIRQSDLKWKLYDVIDEMYNEISAKNIDDILSPQVIVNIIKESIQESASKLLKDINKELSESAKSHKI